MSSHWPMAADLLNPSQEVVWAPLCMLQCIHASPAEVSLVGTGVTSLIGIWPFDGMLILLSYSPRLACVARAALYQ
jgi:hypothetical protein